MGRRNDSNTMNTAKLTKRETEIAEMLAWGGAKKEIASILCRSEDTINNHTRNIYEKIGCRAVNELSAWWFCTNYNISFDLSPLKRKIYFGIMAIITAID